MTYTNEARTEAEKIISEARQINQWEAELAERAIAKQARAILARELKNEQATENAKDWELRIAITRLKFKYDHEAVVDAIRAVTSSVLLPAVQDRKVAVKEQQAAKNETRQ
jgi:hypothetical protein